jgi:hypothetical protein
MISSNHLENPTINKYIYSKKIDSQTNAKFN